MTSLFGVGIKLEVMAATAVFYEIKLSAGENMISREGTGTRKGACSLLYAILVVQK